MSAVWKFEDTVLYDVMFIIQSLPTNVPKTFGKLAELVLKIICHIQVDEIHVFCDRYDVKSIKNAEKQTRGGNNKMYKITGTEKLCTEILKFQNCTHQVLYGEWKLDRYSDYMKQKKIIISHEDQYIQYIVTQTGNVKYCCFISMHCQINNKNNML